MFKFPAPPTFIWIKDFARLFHTDLLDCFLILLNQQVKRMYFSLLIKKIIMPPPLEACRAQALPIGNAGGALVFLQDFYATGYYMLLQFSTCYYRLLQVTTCYYRLLQVTTGYYRLLQVTTGYYRLLKVITLTIVTPVTMVTTITKVTIVVLVTSEKCTILSSHFS